VGRGQVRGPAGGTGLKKGETEGVFFGCVGVWVWGVGGFWVGGGGGGGGGGVVVVCVHKKGEKAPLMESKRYGCEQLPGWKKPKWEKKELRTREGSGYKSNKNGGECPRSKQMQKTEKQAQETAKEKKGGIEAGDRTIKHRREWEGEKAWWRSRARRKTKNEGRAEDTTSTTETRRKRYEQNQ